MNQRGGTKTDAVVKLVLVCFLSLLSFSVGTFVGKQFSDSQHKLANLEADYRAPSSEKDGENEQALSDEDVAALTEEFMKAEKEGQREIASEKDGDKGHGEHGEHKDDHKADNKDAHKSENKKEKGHHETKSAEKADAHGKKDSHEKTAATDSHGKKAEKADAHAKPDAHAKKTTPPQANNAHQEDDHALVEQMKKIAKIDTIADHIAQGQAPTSGKAPERRIASLPKAVAPSTIGKYTVQLASYTTKSEAEAYAVKLKGEGMTAFVLPAVINGKSWYRVSVGVFDKRQDAVALMQDVKKKNRPAIVQKIVQ